MDPGLVGREARIMIGPYSGKSSIRHWLRLHGFAVNEELVDAVYERVKSLYDNGLRREPLSDEELTRIVNELVKLLG
jgi:isopropylmalate/homocitrate/citramalate synthase